ncbi:uncharacterized protein LOC126780871 [Nymphalis io]|uniref:uncharacterized protein LOC126780871 n=1 Tax=Inachis io TaxID=171585 RepID=UPI0021685461|nr:uncharacterized protein LOC126780871 [Nymphalis io]
MSSNRNDCDAVSVVVALVVFALPLTHLVPGFSVWNVLPKVRITRFHIFDYYFSWQQLNFAVITVLVLFFCFYLEIRKRALDEMVENVLTVRQATDVAMKEERDRQAAAVKACVQLLDTSAEHYENLTLLRDELRKREKTLHHPPIIELSSSEM